MTSLVFHLLKRLLALFFLGGMTSVVSGAPPPLILISFDAFRWDYCARYPEATPHLRQLAHEGAAMHALIPAFPTNTFPNHYTIVTGLYPSSHGIINNHFFDASRGEFFRYNQPAVAGESHWWGGEPIWVTAVKQGRKSACQFWPGSEAKIQGVRPSYWRPFNYNAHPFPKRLDEMIGWLQLPAEQRPAVIVFYFEEANAAGHKFGPDSPQLVATIKQLDAQLGALRARLSAAKIAANLLVVSDHGMAPISTEKIMLLDDYVDPGTVHVDFDGSMMGLRPRQGDAAALLHALRSLRSHAHVFTTADLPGRLHFQPTARTPAVWILAEEGWAMYSKTRFEAIKGRYNHGDHGYDPRYPSMHGIFIAHGPSFHAGVILESMENVHVYNLMCAALDLTPAKNDGDQRLARAVLRRERP